jgi:hypothetical protein
MRVSWQVKKSREDATLLMLIDSRPQSGYSFARTVFPVEKRMTRVVSMDSQGRLTVPAAVRAALHLDGPVDLEIEIVEGKLILHPAAAPDTLQDE